MPFIERLPPPYISLYLICTLISLCLSTFWSHSTITRLGCIPSSDITGIEPSYTGNNNEVFSFGNGSETDYEKALKYKEEMNIEPNAKKKMLESKHRTEKSIPNSFNVTEVCKLLVAGKISYFQGLMSLMFDEAWCLLLLLNSAFCASMMFFKLATYLVFNGLPSNETRQIKDRYINFLFYKHFFVFGVMDVKSSSELLIWFTWLSFLIVLLLLAKVSENRLEMFTFTLNVPLKDHLKVCCLLMMIEVCCIALAVSWVVNWSSIPMFPNISLNIHALIFMFTECLIAFLQALRVLFRYAIHLWDARRSEVWEEKDTILYHGDMWMEVIVLAIKLFHYFHMLLCGSVWLTMASLVSCIRLRDIINRLHERYQNYKKYRQVVTNMESRFPEASSEKLAENEDECAICRDPMESARILPCGHLYHSSCLRSWLERDFSCPSCRLRLGRENNNEEQTPAPTSDTTPNMRHNTTAATINNLTNVIGEGRRRQGQLLQFEGSRIASWILSFYVEVLPARSVHQRGVQVLDNPTEYMQSMINEVLQVLPHVSPDAIRTDLLRSMSVQSTIENLLEEGVASNSDDDLLQASMQEIVTPRQAVVSTSDDLLEAVSTSQDSIPPGGTLSQTESSEMDSIESSESLLLPSHFSKDPAERQKTLEARRKGMILRARHKMLKKDTSQSSTTSTNDDQS